MTWLSAQPRLVLRDIDIQYLDKVGVKRFVTLYNLTFQNSRDKHAIYGKAILHQDIPTEATIAIQWLGRKVDLDQIQAKAYVYVSGVSLKQWATKYVWQGWHVHDGVMSAKVWASWNHGAFNRIQTTLQGYGLTLYSDTDKSFHPIKRFSGDIGWKKEGDDANFLQAMIS